MSDSPTWLGKLSFLFSPGAYISGAGFMYVAAKLYPSLKEFITRTEKKRDLREEAEREKARQEREALERDRAAAVARWSAEVQSAKDELAVAKREIAHWKADCDTQRILVSKAEAMADFERLSGQRYYEIGRRAYEMLINARHAWRNGLAAPSDDLPSFEDLTGTKPPVRPSD